MSKRPKKLTPDECEAILNSHIIGTLSLIDHEKPYAVQLEYLYHEGALYMGTYLTGWKIDCMERNRRSVFTVFEDRHGHREIIQQRIPCPVMLEGRIGTLHVKKFTNRKGTTKAYRLLRFDVESMGSWQCSREVCSLVAGLEAKKRLFEWVQEARR